MDVNPLVESDAGRKARSWKNVRYEWEHERGKQAEEKLAEEKLLKELAANSPGGYLPLEGGHDCSPPMQQQAGGASSSMSNLATIDEQGYGSGSPAGRTVLFSKGNGALASPASSKKSTAASRVRVFQA